MHASRPILIVEDDFDVREAIKNILEQHGYAIDVASDGLEALEVLRRSAELPAMILLDIMMPNMDGFHFRAEQMRDPRLAPIPIVVITASSTIFKAYQDVGASESLGKPITVEKLLEVVERNYRAGIEALEGDAQRA